MTRRLLNLLAALSLVLCVAVVGLWVRSWFAWDRGFACGAVAEDGQRVFEFSSARGRVWLSLEQTQGFSLGTGPREGARVYAEDVRLAHPPGTWLGIGYQKQVSVLRYDHTTPTPPTVTAWTVTLAHELIAILAALAPAGWLVAHRRSSNRKLKGTCRRCGYDLQATPGRCPECGEFTAATESSAADSL